MLNNSKIVILGAGLSGLTTAYLLKKAGVQSTILEARDRVGGRIYSLLNNSIAPLEMGATWLGKKHTSLNQLLKELNLESYKQPMGDYAIYEPFSLSRPQLVSLPKSSDESFKVKGGSGNIISTLVNQLDDDQIKLNHQVFTINFIEGQFQIISNKRTLKADYVVSTLPPNLLSNSILFDPQLPQQLIHTSDRTHTWMGESIKIGLVFKTPFWKEEGSSGTIVSNVGPIPEMYDHSDESTGFYSLIGFFNGSFFSLKKEERKAMIIQQLRKYYGEQVNELIDYEEVVWRNEAFTFTDYHHHVLPHQNNGNPIFESKFFNGKFILSGSETARSFPGYMDGAVESANRAVQQLLNKNI